jgi:protein gp37
MKDTLIGWCHHTINFWLGCNRADSAECEGCYAEAQMTLRGKDFNVLRPTRESWYEAERLNASAKARNTHSLFSRALCPTSSTRVRTSGARRRGM